MGPNGRDGLLVLVVEDEPVTLRQFVTILRERGHRVDAAHDGTEALVAVKRAAYDVIFLDVVMPYMTGADFLDSLGSGVEDYRISDATRFVIVTALGEDEFPQSMLARRWPSLSITITRKPLDRVFFEELRHDTPWGDVIDSSPCAREDRERPGRTMMARGKRRAVEYMRPETQKALADRLARAEGHLTASARWWSISAVRTRF